MFIQPGNISRVHSAVSAMESPIPALESPLESAALTELKKIQAEHPFWSNRLFANCQAGHLSVDDFRFIFSQYYFYSRNFTRYLNALMVNCESDLWRARLSENIWEEGGGANPERRHAEIFRAFLRDGLQVPLESIQFQSFTHHFVAEFLHHCVRLSPAAGSAFLSLGTEGIVSRMYSILVNGLRQAGIGEEHLEFFNIHIECDDAHAETLEGLMLSYAHQPGWYDDCLRGLNSALELRRSFFESLMDAVERRRVQGLLERIQARQSLMPGEANLLRFRATDAGKPVYSNTHEKLNIDFAVTRTHFPTEVLDPRFVRIPPGKNNEHHKHAHETVFVVLSGVGKVLVDGTVLDVQQGDLAFVPRWAMHQTHNTGPHELVLLAITDFGLTEKAFIGDHLKTLRMNRARAKEE